MTSFLQSSTTPVSSLISDQNEVWNHERIGERCLGLIRELFPICRSITGPGLRESLELISNQIPLQRTEIGSGARVFDWEIPKEWRINDAFIADLQGQRIVDFKQHNLHVVNYSLPVDKQMAWDELEPHIHWLPNKPAHIPYRTSYYDADWGFCVTGAQRERLMGDAEERFKVVIDSEHIQGHLSYGEFRLEGSSTDEVLISSHVCHPSLANDNLTGIATAIELAQLLQEKKRQSGIHYTYRFLFAPGTIGAIAWLAKNQDCLSRIRHGLVLTLLGDRAGLRFKSTRASHSELDQMVSHLARFKTIPIEIVPFSPTGYDERQFGSLGVDLAVGRLHRSDHTDFAEYHTSADNLDLVIPKHLGEAVLGAFEILMRLEQNKKLISQVQMGEPHLSRRGISFAELVAGKQTYRSCVAWLLNQADGEQTLLEIAQKSELPFEDIAEISSRLLALGLLKCGS